MRFAVLVASSLLLLPGIVRAQEKDKAKDAPPPVAKPEDRVKALEDQVRSLAEEVALLRGELKALRETAAPGPGEPAKLLLTSAKLEPGIAVTAAPAEPVAPQSVPASAGQLPTYGGASANAKLLNPDISIIGDFVGTAGHNRIAPSPSLQLHESEVGLQAIIDPYARGDFFLSFGEEGVNVEEGYITFTALPAGLVAKVGKMRAAFGKVNLIHNHALEYIDRPLVTGNLLGGEDGINDAGISLTRILPAPKGVFLEGTAQVYRGDSADVFTASDRKNVSVVGHLRGYKDLTESTNLDLGFSYARGHNDTGSSFLTNLYGMDATLRWKPLRRAVYHSFLWRNEFVWSHRDQLDALLAPETQKAFGMYSSAEYRLNRRWTVGGRFDRSARARDSSLIDTGFSALLTYWPSEFSQVRGQYRFGRYAEGTDANELLFQFLFVLGAHGAHPF